MPSLHQTAKRKSKFRELVNHANVPEMVCLDDYDDDFPRCLINVLLLDKDQSSGNQTKLMLQDMNYIVSLYCNEDDALDAISKKSECFHVAIVEVSANSSCGSYKFLEMARDIPIIVVSDAQCLSTMMKCIALGATQFLQKPLSEEKLRNIWQHVVHKAFNAGASVISKSLVPIKETVVSMLKLRSQAINDFNTEKASVEDKMQLKTNNEINDVSSAEDDKLSAYSSTLQQEQQIGGRAEEKITICSKVEVVNGEDNKISELMGSKRCTSSVSKSVGNASNNSRTHIVDNANHEEELTSADHEVISASNRKRSDEISVATVKCSSSPTGDHHVENLWNELVVDEDNDHRKKRKNKQSVHSILHSDNKTHDRKKIKIVWNAELHKRFVHAVEQLGIEQAIPSKILEMMKDVKGLTRHNVASHLQKYRLHRRPMLPKAVHCAHKLDSMPMCYMPRPTLHNNHIYQQQYVWSHHYQQINNSLHARIQKPSWNSQYYHTDLMVNADVWGWPVVHPPCIQYSLKNSHIQMFQNSKMRRNLYGHDMDDEIIDKMINEALSNPCLPLPIGLKSPSIEVVISELKCRGINIVPINNKSTVNFR